MLQRPRPHMQQLEQAIRNYLERVVFPIIVHSERAEITATPSESEGVLRFRLLLEPGDVARVIGRNGMTASAIRSMAKAAGEKAGIKVVIHIESSEEANG